MKIRKLLNTLMVLLLLFGFYAVLFGDLLPSIDAATSGQKLYEDSFNYTKFESSSIYDDGLWSVETGKSKPTVENGVLKASEGYSAVFNYQKLDGFTFDKTKNYTIKFDVKITSFGDDSDATFCRELYVAPGGYYNQVELRSANAKPIRTGDTHGGTLNGTYKLNTLYTIEVVWEPLANKITSTLKEGNTVISTGFRTNSAYGSKENYLSTWVFRCEDGGYEMDNFSFTYGDKVYSQNFDLKPTEDCMSYNGYWRLESLEKTGTAPAFVNGVLKFDDKDSVEFLWTKLTEYSTEKIYTFEFDVKVTDLGDGSNMGVVEQSRVLYVAPGGYYNQLQLYSKDGKIIAGETSIAFDSAVHLNKNLHVKMTYEGSTITTSLYDENNKLIVTGSRTNGAYTNMTDRNSTMARFVLRCEDGSCEIDNFVFSEKEVVVNEVASFEIEQNKAANYSCVLDYNGEDPINLKLNGNNILNLTADGMKVCSGIVKGQYGSGKYKVNMSINPTQRMVNVEIILPNGGVVRRGTYDLVSSTGNTYKVSLSAYDANIVTESKVTFEDVETNEYTITTEEPSYTGSNEYIYNIISSFDDPATTRNFAWTVSTEYIEMDMSVKYRIKGETEWNYVDGVLEEENISMDEDYYKADLTDLKPNTEYEFKIGITESDDEEYDWTKTYTFKTASGDEDEFTFIAVGDTQGMTWNGTAASNKGFMYAKAAYEQALKEVPNLAFILHAGDVVENGDNQTQWNYFFKSLGEAGASIPHFAAIGNHDVVYKAPDAKFYFNLHFNHPNNGGLAALNQEKVNLITNAHLKQLASKANETVYSYNYGDAHFIVLNSGNYSASDQYILEAQREWLELDLKANACAKWTVILVHEAVYHRLGGSESRPWLYDLIEEYNVDLVIQGHSHLVTRTYPMKNGQIVTKENPDVITQGTGTVYTTIGSTALNHDGMGSTNVEECLLITTPVAQQSAYTTVKVNGDKLVMTVKQIDGLILDSFTILASGEKGHVGEEEVINVKEATCEDGYTGDTICSHCKKVIQKGEVVKATKEHAYGEWVITKEATSTEKGEKEQKCTICGHTSREEIPMKSKESKGCGGSIYASIFGLVGLFAAMISLKKKKD